MAKKIAIIVAAGLLVLLAGGAFIWLSGGSGEPSAEVTAPTIATTTAATAADTSEATTAAVAGQTEATVAETASVTYDIDKTQSTVQFELDEVLRNEPTHVVGTTSEVAGQILIDFDDPAQSQLGTIVINVRTLSTNSSFRDRAIRGQILDSSSDENEFAEFTPTDIQGLPGSVGVGDTVPLTVTGDFLLSGVTQPVTFAVSVLVVAEDRLEISGSAEVLRSEFGLSIPSVAQVADVSDAVQLVIDLVAVAS